MKKRWFGLLALAACFAFVIACGSKEEAAKDAGSAVQTETVEATPTAAAAAEAVPQATVAPAPVAEATPVPAAADTPKPEGSAAPQQ